MINLANKVALITGASRGIGRAIALIFAQAGARTLVHYHRAEQAAREVARQAEQQGSPSRVFRADISHREEVQRMIEYAVKEFGGLDLLVNNAGIWEEAAIDQMTEEQLRRTMSVNLDGVFHASTIAAAQMIKQRSGNIINISSTAGQRGEAYHAHYAAAKSAVIGLTKSLAVELATHNIRVNCVAPGWVVSDMTREILTGPEKEKVLRQIPLARAGTPEEIAGCVLFLASDLSTFVTGEILNANGGAVLCG